MYMHGLLQPVSRSFRLIIKCIAIKGEVKSLHVLSSILGVFAIFYPTFGQMIAAFCPNELLASLLVPAFFTSVVSICGVVVPYANIHTFWRRWMYWLTPFHYLLEGMLGVITNDVPVNCSEQEYAKFTLPPGKHLSGVCGPVCAGSRWVCYHGCGWTTFLLPVCERQRVRGGISRVLSV